MKQIHLINVPSYVESTISFIRQLCTKVLREKVNIVVFEIRSSVNLKLNVLDTRFYDFKYTGDVLPQEVLTKRIRRLRVYNSRDYR